MKWSDIIYAPQAKWKYGERTAIARLRGEMADRLLPLFRLPPPGDFDPELEKTITPELYLKTFGAQLAEARGRRPALLDGTAIQDLYNEDSGKLFFAELLERGRLAGGLPIPVIDEKCGKSYTSASVAFAKRATNGSVCLRIGVTDLEFIESRETMISSVASLGIDAKNCALLIDSGGLAIDDVDQFCSVLASQISRLVVAGDWRIVIWSGTAFPEAIKLQAGQSSAYDRTDWKIYRHMKDASENFSVLPVFSDYLLEYASNVAPFRATPTAQLRYSSENRYFVFKGESVKKSQKYRNIIPVAEALVGSGIFKGESFSQGDAFIKALTEKPASTGHAGTWRWCSNDHHIALVTNQLAAAFGLELERAEIVVEPDQMRLVELFEPQSKPA